MRHALEETRKTPVRALVFVGDAMEERLDVLAGLAAELGLSGMKAFLFQEGRDGIAEQAFRQIARLTGGAYAAFDFSAPERLVALLSAAAAYAGGRARALEYEARLCGVRSRRTLLSQMRQTGGQGMIIYLLGRDFAFLSRARALRAFAADPARWRSSSGAAAAAALFAALLLLLRGRFDMAIGLGGLGAWLLGYAMDRCSGCSSRPADAGNKKRPA